MRVLVLGGTGTIGAPVVRELLRARHEVVALARSDRAATQLARLGALTISGDIATPERWLASLPVLDGVIQAAAAFSTDDEGVERHLLQELLPFLDAAANATRFIYTGGCWLFGPAGSAVTTEESPFDPLPAFAWSVRHSREVLGAPGIRSIVIHPAMVYGPCGGVFSRFLADARGRHAVRVIGGEHVCWPLVHSEDLAVLYRLALERSGPGEEYIGAAIEGHPVGRLARAFADRFDTPRAEPEIISEDEIAAELGEWARGYGRDQQQSGAKARRVLGWEPVHVDPQREIAHIA
jgi:nucleoside-diphosphate-sugar epimerase